LFGVLANFSGLDGVTMAALLAIGLVNSWSGPI